MKECINIDNKLENDTNELFSHLRIPWKRTKEDSWSGIAKRIQEPKIIQLQPKTIGWKVASAAVIFLALSIGFFMSTYTVNFHSRQNLFATIQMPDGSKVFVNTNSNISYKPYWWWVNRDVKLKGEAFFEVQKGKKFRVLSENGTTEVLGTSFNVFARDQLYEVVCVTGKVKVQAALTEHTVILHPTQKALLLETGELNVESEISVEQTKAWFSNRLEFTSQPLKEVFKYIEILYDIEIIIQQDVFQEYTGSFDKPSSADEALKLICRPFNLKVEKLAKKKYRIIE